eukprot:9280527-Pyramimonas_sp.AAC.1
MHSSDNGRRYYLRASQVGSLILANFAPRILGKDSKTGAVPFWSKAVFWSAHLWNHYFVRVTYWKRKRRGIAAATEVRRNQHA